jgi:hypothetical protein
MTSSSARHAACASRSPDALLTSVNQCLTKPTARAPLEMK